MNIKFELEPDLTETVTPIAVAHALTKVPQFDEHDILELAEYLHIYAAAVVDSKMRYGGIGEKEN